MPGGYFNLNDFRKRKSCFLNVDLGNKLFL